MKTYRSLSYLPAITLLTGLFCEASSILSGTARAAPVVSLSSAVGPPKTTVNVSGTGFGASALVDIYFDMNDLCLTFASDTGTVSCVIKVPKEAQPQTHWISAVQRST